MDTQAGPVRHSAEEYFALLLERAELAARDGNYGIAAALVVRSAGSELVALAVNSVFREHNPCGHAEINAILRARSVGLASADPCDAVREMVSRGDAVVRPAPHDDSEAVLYATLEPCPMCTVAILTAGIDRVVIAAEDPPSGSLRAVRLAALPPIWPELARRLDVVWAQSGDPGDARSYLPAPLQARLVQVFVDSREALDAQLGETPVLDTEAIGNVVNAFARNTSTAKGGVTAAARIAAR